jgi:hypothetical protein
MKKLFGMLTTLLVLVSSMAFSETTPQLNIQGKIGDLAPQSRIYEINGTIYSLPEETIIEDTHGRKLNFLALKPGVEVNLIGHTDYVNNEIRTIIEKVIVLNLQNQ